LVSVGDDFLGFGARVAAGFTEFCGVTEVCPPSAMLFAPDDVLGFRGHGVWDWRPGGAAII